MSGEITFLTDCQVHLLSEPKFYPHPKYELPPDGSEAERLIATGGKVCYDSYGAEGHPVVKHVENLVKQLHFSVVEHVNVSLFIEGISRGCSHEIVRHRHFSYSQRSTRYTDEGDAAIVLEPYMARLEKLHQAEIRDGIELINQNELKLLTLYKLGAHAAVQSYGTIVRMLLDQAPQHLSKTEQRKWARGKARQRLPHDIETRMVMTGNIRSWIEFLVKRTNVHAEPEIRRLAEKIYFIVQPIVPSAFSGMTVSVKDGYVVVEQ